MTDSFSCDVCGKDFAEENALMQHKQAKHLDEPQSSEFGETLGSLFLTGLGTVLVLGLIYLGYTNYTSWAKQSVNYPTKGDHWHAPYSIVICGDTVPNQPYSQGDVHTHGQGRIHVHPHSESTAGANANLGAFFRSFNGTLTENKVSVPQVGTYENGDNCDGEPGEVAVFVNGERISDPSDYVIQDGDQIRVTFRPN